MSNSIPMTLSLNAFIKLYAMDMHKQMAEISRRMDNDSGGYDFYRTLGHAVKAFIEDKTSDEIDYILNSASSPSEANYNLLAFNAFKKKFGSKKKSLSVFGKTQKVLLAEGSVCVVVNPSFMLESSKGMEVYHIWATQNPSVTQHMGSMACYLSKEAFRKTPSANYAFKLFDAVGNRVYAAQLNNTPALVERAAQNIAHWAAQ